MEDLIELDSCRPAAGKWSVNERLSGIFTPLSLPQWESMLERHPDKRYVEFILKGIKDGFRVGFQRSGESNLLFHQQRRT